MIPDGRRNTGRVRILGATLLGLCLVFCPTDELPPRAADGGAGYDLAARPLDLIPAGTVIEGRALAGYTHLLLKSQPRPGAGDTARISPEHAALAGLLFTALAARVEKNQDRYRLDSVAVGVGSRVGEHDLILTPEAQKRLGADLGFLARIVLSRACQRLADVRTVARSPAMIVFDAPNWMLRDGRHRPVVLRYAVLVTEATGRLDTLEWLLDRGEDDRLSGPVGPAQWLAPCTVDEAVLHVDAREFTLGNPNESSFALVRLPQGRRAVDFPDPLRDLAARPRLSAPAAADLEAGLRAVLNETAKR
jgi:hypothetical protein